MKSRRNYLWGFYSISVSFPFLEMKTTSVRVVHTEIPLILFRYFPLSLFTYITTGYNFQPSPKEGS